MIFFLVKFIVAPLFQLFDLIVPKRKNYWAFSVHHIKSDQFVENARAVFEEVKHDQAIKKYVFARNNDTTNFEIEDAHNCEILNLKSFKGLLTIVRCKVVFVTHSLSMDYSLRFPPSDFVVLKFNMKNRLVVNLWHGIPYKKLYALWNPLVRQRLDRVKFRQYERTMYAGLISSSEIDSYAMGTMFHPIKYENIWVTGLPRNDFLTKDSTALPKYIQHQINKVNGIKGSKKLVVYAPTYRQTAAVSTSAYYQFSDAEINSLLQVLKKHNAILGIRLHYFRNNNQLFNIEKYIDNEHIVDLGHNISPEIAPVIRESDVVISDYSSVFIEALYINKRLSLLHTILSIIAMNKMECYTTLR
jgi:CDP-glycerol glycerophosphotransferase (TagB/SpsB family)